MTLPSSHTSHLKISEVGGYGDSNFVWDTSFREDFWDGLVGGILGN